MNAARPLGGSSAPSGTATGRRRPWINHRTPAQKGRRRSVRRPCQHPLDSIEQQFSGRPMNQGFCQNSGLADSSPLPQSRAL